MRLFECSVCNHLEFENAPEMCPACYSRNAFQENPDVIEQPGLPDRAEADSKHIPKIVIAKECGLIPDGSCMDIHVKVGEVEHPMQEKHHIRFIDLYHDYSFLGRILLSPLKCHPAGALHARIESGKITVVENCNIHGHWMAEVNV